MAYEILIIGAGHAGCEAALAAARGPCGARKTRSDRAPAR